MNTLQNKQANLAIVVVVDEKNAIGYQNNLLCHLPADLRHFKELTTGHMIIMGRNTYFSLPKRPLPNRRNVVVTHQSAPIEAAEIVHSIEEAYTLLAPNETAFVIGGGSLYAQCMPLANRLYVTHIHHTFEQADTFFPEIATSQWQQTACENHEADEKNEYPYTFAVYERK